MSRYRFNQRAANRLLLVIWINKLTIVQISKKMPSVMTSRLSELAVSGMIKRPNPITNVVADADATNPATIQMLNRNTIRGRDPIVRRELSRSALDAGTFSNNTSGRARIQLARNRSSRSVREMTNYGKSSRGKPLRTRRRMKIAQRV